MDNNLLSDADKACLTCPLPECYLDLQHDTVARDAAKSICPRNKLASEYSFTSPQIQYSCGVPDPIDPPASRSRRFNRTDRPKPHAKRSKKPT